MVAEASNGEDALAVVARELPDVVLVDVEMPGPPVIALIAQIRRGAPRTRIIVLSMHDDPGITRAVLAAGAAAYLSKTIETRDLVEALLHVGAGAGAPSTSGAATGPLSLREREVLRLIAQGRSNQQIADRLFITVGTVKRHVGHIFAKLGVHSRTQALNAARLIGALAE